MAKIGHTERHTTRSPAIRPTLILALVLLTTAACGDKSREAPTDGEAVKARAEVLQTAQHRTGAEQQDAVLNRTVRAAYLCNNGERLSVDFDNPRMMATVRNSTGVAVDLHQERGADGIWYRASGYELRGKGTMATWTADGRAPTDCRAID